jgi:hypothetical protein
MCHTPPRARQRPTEALAAYDDALRLITNTRERDYLQLRRARLRSALTVHRPDVITRGPIMTEPLADSHVYETPGAGQPHTREPLHSGGEFLDVAGRLT